MTNYTDTAFTASNESSRFWGFFFYFGRACGTGVCGVLL